MRLFVALDIPEFVRAALSECAAQLSKLCPKAKWVRLEGAHITLKFIGEVPAEQAESIRLALAEIRSLHPVELNFTGLGFFPNAKRPRVLWAGIDAGPELAQLAAAVEERTVQCGIERETREFRPHVTLARFEEFGSRAALERLSESVAKMGAPEFGRTVAREFYLYRSVLQRSGAEYTRLSSYAFCGE